LVYILESLKQGYQKVKLQKLSFSQKESDTLSQNIIFSAQAASAIHYFSLIFFCE
jgi:hypothetical protein